ncbi:MAG TPA: hypothetical protein VF624_03625 [Tepidisphaeraceae bacterium]
MPRKRIASGRYLLVYEHRSQRRQVLIQSIRVCGRVLFQECIMSRMFSLVGSVVVAAGVAVAAYAHEGKHAEGKAGENKVVTVQGELIDTACYTASGGEAKGKDHAECASQCLGSGIPAGILPEGSKAVTDMVFLLANPKPLAQYAGKTIKIEGESHPGMRAIDPKKVHVQDGSGGWKEIKLDDFHHKMGGGDDVEKKATQGGPDHGGGHK